MQRSPTEEELPMLAVAPTHIAVDTLLEGVLNVAEDINLKRFGKLLAQVVEPEMLPLLSGMEII